MTSEASVPQTAIPSARTLAMTTLAAAAAATMVLVSAVLPAEYGVDPLGTGKALGLLALSAPAAVESAPVAAAAGDANVPIQSGPLASYGAPYRADAVEITLSPYEY